MTYRGNELEQAIQDSVNSYDWESVTGTTNRGVQQGLIFNALSKPFRVKNYTLNLTSRGEEFEIPQPVGSSGSISVYAPPYGFVATSFSVEKVPPPVVQHFSYNYPSKFGTFTLPYTLTDGVYSVTPMEAERRFNEWLKEQELLQPITDPSIESAFDEPEPDLPSIYGGQYVPPVEPTPEPTPSPPTTVHIPPPEPDLPSIYGGQYVPGSEPTTEEAPGTVDIPPVEPEPEVTTDHVPPPEMPVEEPMVTPTEPGQINWIPEPFFSFINNVFRK